MSTNIDLIDPVDAHGLVANGAAVIVDVREADARETEHIAGSVSIPLGELAERLGELPDGVQVLTACGGGTRGPKAAEQLRELGVDARVVRGGLRGWKSAELPVD